MRVEILNLEDLNLPEDFVFQKEEAEEDLIRSCSICSDCCVTDCTGGN